MPPNGAGVPWKKVLYLTQPYPDNYTDDTFLEHLVVNLDVRERSYWGVVYGTTVIVQQASVVAATVTVPVYLHEGRLSSTFLLAINVLLLLAGYALCCLAGGKVLGGSLGRGVRQCGLLAVGIYGMSDLYMSLARTISADTIVACVVILLLIHLYICDYGYVADQSQSIQGSLSLGAAVGASILIASRLGQREQVFSHVLFSLEMYLLSPFVRRHIRRTHTVAHLATTLALSCGAAMMLAPLSAAAAVAFCAGMAFVMFGCPLWLVRIQKYKQKINGNWDEAVPKWSNRVVEFQRQYSSGGATVSANGGGRKVEAQYTDKTS